ncbi:MAG: hypothetical protein ABIE74_11770 [Pseudomonadota bacterium]
MNIKEKIDIIDKMLRENKASHTALMNIVNDKVAMNYFVDRVDDPDWISIFKKEGCFNKTEDWVVGLLSKFATDSPKDVSDIIVSLPYTENEWHHRDFVEAAIKMSVEYAVKIAKKEIEWIETRESIFHIDPRKYGSLINKLCHDGEANTALELTKSLLEISKEKLKGDFVLVKLKTKIETWSYDQLVKMVVPDLTKYSQFDALELFSKHLDNALINSRESADKNKPCDYSNMWREKILSSSRMPSDDIKNSLVTAVRDSAIIICEANKNNSNKISEVIKKIEDYNWDVFKRISLYLLDKFSDVAADLIVQRLTKKEYFEELGVYNEFYQLWKIHFNLLNPDQKENILNWITKYEIEPGLNEDKKQSELFLKNFQRDWFEAISDKLPSKYKEHYDALIKEIGHSEHPGSRAPVHRTMSGPNSPKSIPELSEMKIEQLIECLKEWKPKPSGEFMSPSPEGLGRNLTGVIEENSSCYAKNALEFKKLDEPTYIKSILRGFLNACNNQKIFDWDQVLELCRWIVIDDPKYSDRNKELLREYEQDPDWNYTYSTIARFLEAGFSQKDTQIPNEYRKLAWVILDGLFGKRYKLPKEEFNPDNDYIHESYNKFEGQLFHTLIQYALWVRRELELNDSSEENRKKLQVEGFNNFPEVIEKLNDYLDNTDNYNGIIHSVLGQRFAWLLMLDKSVTVNAKGKIFSDDQFGETAWRGYLEFSAPYDSVFELIKNNYKNAVKKLGTPYFKNENDRIPTYIENLAEHIIQYYWRGLISLNDEIVKDFFKQSPLELRGYALNFIGRVLKSEKDKIPDEVMDRFIKLWERRFSEIKDLPGGEKTPELKAFIYWFRSGKFEMKWAFERLNEVLENLNKGEDGVDSMFMEYLAHLSEEYPQECIKILHKIVEKNLWRAYMFFEEDIPETIIKNALEHDSSEATKKIVREVITRFLENGYFKLRELWPE